MRKFLAVILSISLVFPLLVARQAALNTVSWALERQFYTDALDQEQVYQALLSNQTLDNILRSQFSLPLEADIQALRMSCKLWQPASCRALPAPAWPWDSLCGGWRPAKRINRSNSSAQIDYLLVLINLKRKTLSMQVHGERFII